MTGHTVLILGAGASLAYGLPLGKGLVSKICELLPDTANRRMSDRAMALHNQLQDLPEVRSWLMSHRADLGPILINFRQRLIESDPKSIDEFLSRDFGDGSTAFRAIGKMAIAHVIAAGESESAIQNLDQPIADQHSAKDHWYRYLWQDCLNRDVAALEAIKTKKLQIISFNYDRSIEYFLGKRIAATYRTAPTASLDPSASHNWAEGGYKFVADELQITHPYGTLGTLSEVPYGDSNNSKCYGKDMSKRIRVIGEERVEDSFSLARKWIEESSRVVFLGFSFDTTNMKRLGLEGGLQPKIKSLDIFGSKQIFPLTYGLERAERMQLHSKYFGGFFQNQSASPHTPNDDSLSLSETHHNMGITTYLRRYGALSEV